MPEDEKAERQDIPAETDRMLEETDRVEQYRKEAVLPSNLRLIDIDVPDLSRLSAIRDVGSKYCNWVSSVSFRSADYDDVAADLVRLSGLMLSCFDCRDVIALAYKDALANRDTIYNYHYYRLRSRADAEYFALMEAYKKKQCGKPDRETDSSIKAHVEIMLAVLGMPKQLNDLESSKNMVEFLFEQAENLCNTLKKALDRAQRHGG